MPPPKEEPVVYTVLFTGVADKVGEVLAITRYPSAEEVVKPIVVPVALVPVKVSAVGSAKGAVAVPVVTITVCVAEQVPVL